MFFARCEGVLLSLAPHLNLTASVSCISQSPLSSLSLFPPRSMARGTIRSSSVLSLSSCEMCETVAFKGFEGGGGASSFEGGLGGLDDCDFLGLVVSGPSFLAFFFPNPNGIVCKSSGLTEGAPQLPSRIINSHSHPQAKVNLIAILSLRHAQKQRYVTTVFVPLVVVVCSSMSLCL